MALTACHDCDLLLEIAALPDGARAECTRCGALLRRQRDHGIEHTLALAISAAVLFGVANAFPFLAFDMKGQVTQTTLATGVKDLWNAGTWEISLLVAFTSLVAPMLQISLLLYVLVPIHAGRIPWKMAPAFRLLRRVQPWSMMEVFLIGIAVAVTKLIGMAEVIPGPSLFAFVALILVLAGAMASLDPHAVWERLERRA